MHILYRFIRTILIAAVLSAVCVACGGGGGGSSVSQAPPPAPPSPPPPPPPALSVACTGADSFPGFMYQVESTATEPNELRLSSTDGCRTESLGIFDFRQTAFHMTADRSAGVVVWNEEIETGIEVVWRLDFTVDFAVNPDGDLVLGTPVQILPLVGEEAPAGDFLSYPDPSIWGDATHDSLYLAIFRGRTFGPDINSPAGDQRAMIYDLNALTDVNATPAVREIYSVVSTTGTEFPDWHDVVEPDCIALAFPRYVASCHRLEDLRFNPSGTRIYIQGKLFHPDGRRDKAVMRIDLGRQDAMGVTRALADWTITGPELVYLTGSAVRDAPGGWTPRPASDVSMLPSPEYIAVYHRDGGAITEVASIMNADKCASDFAPYAGGDLEAPIDLWVACIDHVNFFTGSLSGASDAWQSADALLKSSFQDPEYDIHRIYVSGALAGTEQLMIETARSANTGF